MILWTREPSVTVKHIVFKFYGGPLVDILQGFSSFSTGIDMTKKNCTHIMKTSPVLIGFIAVFYGFLYGTGLSQNISFSIPSSIPSTEHTEWYLPHRNASVPKRIIVGYASWDQCDEKIIEAVQNGVNVVMWFSIDFTIDSMSKSPIIRRGPNRTCVHDIQKRISDLGYADTVHIISIGGWNAPHLDTTASPEMLFTTWKLWNNGTFDGIDWDLEGNDDPSSPWNKFTATTLDYMGQISQLAKQEGFIVSMAPMESYLDPSTPEFDLDLRHSYPEWESILDFKYHGRNTYAYLLSRYGQAQLGSAETSAVDTFDFITVQFYESYARVLYRIKYLKENVVDSMLNAVEQFYKGWKVEFSLVPELGYNDSSVQIHPSNLVIGLANAWADNKKSLLLLPEELYMIEKSLHSKGISVRGYGYWTIAEEDGMLVNSTTRLNLARELNSFLHIRQIK